MSCNTRMSAGSSAEAVQAAELAQCRVAFREDYFAKMVACICQAT
jgi:hypothetical protein